MRSRLRLAAAVSTGVFSATMAHAAIIIRQVAYSGQAVPVNAGLTYTTQGVDGAVETTNPISNETFNSFTAPSINDAGDTTFMSVDTGSANVATVQNSSNSQNIYSLLAEHAGTLTLIAHEGTYSPDRGGNPATAGDSTGNFSTFNTGTGVGTFIGANDHVTVYATVKTPGTSTNGTNDTATPTNIGVSNNTAIYSDGGGSLALRYRKADPITSSNSSIGVTTITGFASNPNTGAVPGGTAVNPSGLVASEVTIANSTIAGGIVSDPTGSGTLSFVAEGNAASPIAGTTYNGSNFHGPVINASGQVAFAGSLNVAGTINSNNSNAIFSQGGGLGLHLVAQGFGQAGGLPAGDAYSNTGLGQAPDINNAGQIVFASTLVNNPSLGAGDLVTATSNTSGGATANNDGLFEETPATSTTSEVVSLIARRGSQAVGAPTGVVYSGFTSPVINDAGEIATEVSFTNAANAGAVPTGTTSAIYTFDAQGNATLIARNGSVAPGTGGLLYSSVSNNVAINGLGEVAFTSPLTATVGGATISGSTSLFADDQSGNVFLLIEDGQPFDGLPGTVSSFSPLTNSGGEDGKASTFNDSGTIPVEITFSTGAQGIFTVSVPEPSSMAMILLSCGSLFPRRRSRRIGQAQSTKVNPK